MSSEKLIRFTVSPADKIDGDIYVPGDKSVSHRSIMFGSLAEGITEVYGFLEGEDALATLNTFRKLGVKIEGPVNGRVTIHGVGMHGLKGTDEVLDMGNSGTSIRLLAGLLAGQKFTSTLTGDNSLRSRPMKRVTDPLALMGAEIETAEGGKAPLVIRGGAPLKGIKYKMPMASAQVKSCVLLAGLYAEGESSVVEPAPTRDHTERMLDTFGYDVKREADKVTIQGGGKFTACELHIPCDISSAAFFLVAGSIAQLGELVIRNVGMNPTRTGILEILWLMGADITVINEKMLGAEPVADLVVKPAKLKGIDIPEELVPLAIDEFPVLFVAAVAAQGRTRLTGAEELRVKESDRIQVMADGLIALGADATPTEDGIVINGGGLNGGAVESHDDHRIAMAFSVASLICDGDIVINNCANVATSFPGFADLANKVGLNIEVSEV